MLSFVFDMLSYLSTYAEVEVSVKGHSELRRCALIMAQCRLMPQMSLIVDSPVQLTFVLQNYSVMTQLSKW